MYGIYANIGGILMVNVTIYSLHGSYGIGEIQRKKTGSNQSKALERLQSWYIPWRIHGAAICLATWIPSIYPLYVSINIAAPWIRHGFGYIPQSEGVLLQAAGRKYRGSARCFAPRSCSTVIIKARSSYGSENPLSLKQKLWIYMAVCQNLVPLVNIKIAGKWMFIPLKMVLIGIDPYPYEFDAAWGRVTIWDQGRKLGQEDCEHRMGLSVKFLRLHAQHGYGWSGWASILGTRWLKQLLVKFQGSGPSGSP